MSCKAALKLTTSHTYKCFSYKLFCQWEELIVSKQKFGELILSHVFLKTAASRYLIQKTDCLARLYYNKLIQYKDKINARSSVFHFMLHVCCFYAQ